MEQRFEIVFYKKKIVIAANAPQTTLHITSSKIPHLCCIIIFVDP